MGHRGRFSINTLACTSHRTITPLFEAILCYAWFEILYFLKSGRWSRNTDFYDSTLTPEEQARKWIVYQDRYSEDRLRQLPLHAALAHLAPLPIIEFLVALYPSALHLPDGKGNLPLHIAFMTNAHDSSAFLLRSYPEGLMEANANGDLPVDCYQATLRTVPQLPTSENLIERSELLQLENNMAKERQRMSEAQLQLQDLKEDLQNICNYGRRRQLRSLSVSRSDFVEL